MGLQKLKQYLSTIWMLARYDLKMRYYGSWLGIFWMFLKPLCIFLVLNFVFSSFFSRGNPGYSVKLLVGLILWMFFAETTTNGMLSLANKQFILKKVYFPKIVIILASSLESFLAFLFKLAVLFVFLIFFYQIYPSPLQLLMFLGYILLIYGISLIFSFIAAPLFIWLRDLNQVWEVSLNVLFYAAPILYPLTMLPEKLQRFLYLNPMTLLVEHSRMVLIDNNVPPSENLYIYLIVFFICFFLSMLILRKLSRNLIENL